MSACKHPTSSLSHASTGMTTKSTSATRTKGRRTINRFAASFAGTFISGTTIGCGDSRINITGQEMKQCGPLFGLKRNQFAKPFVYFSSASNVDGPAIRPMWLLALAEMRSRLNAKLFEQRSSYPDQFDIRIAEANRAMEKSAFSWMTTDMSFAIKQGG